ASVLICGTGRWDLLHGHLTRHFHFSRWGGGAVAGWGFGVSRCWMLDVRCWMFDVFGWAELALGARWWHPEARFLDFDGTRRLFSPPKMRLEETLSLTPALSPRRGRSTHSSRDFLHPGVALLHGNIRRLLASSPWRLCALAVQC